MKTFKNLSGHERIYALTITAIFIAIEWVWAFVPELGYITVGVVAITTMLIPVIIITCLFGCFHGFISGLMFGITSLIQSYLQPAGLNILFNNPVISILPRVLVVFFIVGYNWMFKKITRCEVKKNKILAVIKNSLVAGFSSITHTVLVVGALLIFYSSEVLQKTDSNNAIEALGILFTFNAAIELGVTIAISVPCIMLLQKVLEHSSIRGKRYSNKPVNT